jgi:hypothetical protein
MPRPQPRPHVPAAEEEVGSGRGRMVLQLVLAPSAGARRSSPLAALLQPRAALSAAGILIAPLRMLAPGSHAATWPRRLGSGTHAGRVAVRQHRRSRPRWRAGRCWAPVRAQVVSAHGRATGLRPDGALVGCRSRCRAHPEQGRPARGADRRFPAQARSAQASAPSS